MPREPRTKNQEPMTNAQNIYCISYWY